MIIYRKEVHVGKVNVTGEKKVVYKTFRWLTAMQPAVLEILGPWQYTGGDIIDLLPICL